MLLVYNLPQLKTMKKNCDPEWVEIQYMPSIVNSLFYSVFNKLKELLLITIEIKLSN